MKRKAERSGGVFSEVSYNLEYCVSILEFHSLALSALENRQIWVSPWGGWHGHGHSLFGFYLVGVAQAAYLMSSLCASRKSMVEISTWKVLRIRMYAGF